MTDPFEQDEAKLYRLTLSPIRQTGAPAVVRLRRLLKALLRGYGYGFRGQAVEELPGDQGDAAEGATCERAVITDREPDRA
jgi:hypothetical protein